MNAFDKMKTGRFFFGMEVAAGVAFAREDLIATFFDYAEDAPISVLEEKPRGTLSDVLEGLLADEVIGYDDCGVLQMTPLADKPHLAYERLAIYWHLRGEYDRKAEWLVEHDML